MLGENKMMDYAISFVLMLGLANTLCQGKQASQNLPQEGCKLEGLHPLLIVTYKNLTITVDSSVVSHSEKVTVRCRELGKYKLIGDSVLQCRNGAWNGNLPTCKPTTAISNYTEDVPPTILFGLPSGTAAVEPSGALAVFPGSILHLECLFARKLGNPEWTWTSTFRQYLTGWAIAAFERDWKYRLSIYYAKAQDSGVYTCSTPKGLTNSIKVQVVDVNCPTLKSNAPLIAKIEGSRLGETATFDCPNGYRMEGKKSIVCQYNGKWSGDVPKCEAIICPEIEPESPKLQLIEYNNTYGGLAVFSCLWGHAMHGPRVVQCTREGVWNGTVPTCTEIICPPPDFPINGRVHDKERKYKKRRWHTVGSIVNFSCLPNHQLIGQSTVICTDSGTWSHEPPVCEVRCSYPGDPPHGRIVPLKFWYKPGDTIQVYCKPGYVTPLEPVHRPTCRESGIWSEPPPPCRSYRDVR